MVVDRTRVSTAILIRYWADIDISIIINLISQNISNNVLLHKLHHRDKSLVEQEGPSPLDRSDRFVLLLDIPPLLFLR